jgi:hypothetical protein
MKTPPAALAILWAAAATFLVLALAPVPGLIRFQAGLLHPLLVPTHALALAALGLFFGRQAQRARTAGILTFAAGLIGGIGAITAAFVFTAGTWVLLATAGAAGLLVAAGLPTPIPLAAGLAACGGLALAFNSVPDEISTTATLAALAGTAIAASLAVTLLAASVAHAERDWLRIGIRIAGSWIAASAILVLALRLAR